MIMVYIIYAILCGAAIYGLIGMIGYLILAIKYGEFEHWFNGLWRE